MIDRLSDPKYEKIVLYLNKTKTPAKTYLEILNELKFIPGVPMRVLEEAKIHLKDSEDKYSKSDSNINLVNKIKCLSDSFFDAQFVDSEVDYQCDNNRGLDTFIQLIRQIPRSQKLIGRLKTEGRFTLEDIEKLEFEYILSTRGLGKLTAANIFKLIETFFNSKTYLYDSKLLSNKHSKSVYDTTNHNVFLEDFSFYTQMPEIVENYLNETGVKNLQGLLLVTIAAKRLYGIQENVIKNIFKQVKKYVSYNSDIYSELCTINLEYNSLKLRDVVFGKRAVRLIEKLDYNNLDVNAYVMGLNVHRSIDEFPIIQELKLSPIKKVEFILDSLNSDDKKIYSLRLDGMTLEEIGLIIGVTRERIRQIVKRIDESLYGPVNLMISSIERVERDSIYPESYFQEILELDYEMFRVFRQVLSDRDSSIISYNSQFSLFHSREMSYDIFEIIKNSLIEVTQITVTKAEVVNHIQKEVNDIIGIFISDEVVEHIASKFNFKVSEKFILGTTGFGSALAKLVEIYFPDGIKLDEREDNSDLLKLRELKDELMPDLKISENNRALSARLMDYLILKDRGVYTSYKYLNYDLSLIEGIKKYIDEYEYKEVPFATIFNAFKTELIEKTNICNKYNLQGVLRYHFSNLYSFRRDVLEKKHGFVASFSEIVAMEIMVQQKPISISYLISKFGVSEPYIYMNISHDKNIIVWAQKELFLSSLVEIEEGKMRLIKDLITEDIELFGYNSSSRVYNKLLKEGSNVLGKSGLTNFNIYGFLKNNFDSFFDFKENPHITRKGFMKSVNSYSIINKIVKQDNIIDTVKMIDFCKRFAWSEMTSSILFSALRNDAIRISKNEYVYMTDFCISDEQIELIDNVIEGLFYDSLFYPINDIYDYSSFPTIGYEYNAFFIESYCNKISKIFDVVSPKIYDRRYVKSVIVRKDTYTTFDELVYSLLEDLHYTSIFEADLLELLSNHGLIMKVIPNDIYVSPLFSYRDHIFHLRRNDLGV